jgi:SAM-dependent MidA family methyltransferase
MREIRREIEERGPLPFARFMELALYHPERGYYCRARDPFGVAGDYFTNAQLQPVFGRLVAQKLAAWREQLGEPDFTVVELGAGRGETAAVVRRSLPGLRYLEVERFRGEIPPRVRGVVFANEFFDALPVHVARWDGARWRERYVGAQGWTEGDLSTPDLAGYLARWVQQPEPGRIVEVGLEALRWLERIAARLESGYVLIIDYGYLAAEMVRFPKGSLMGYCRHTAVEDVLAEPGERDITAHVAFTPLLDRAAELGLRTEPLCTQAAFLLSVGEPDQFASALAASTEAEARRHRALLKTLLYGMGETFRVMVLQQR